MKVAKIISLILVMPFVFFGVVSHFFSKTENNKPYTVDDSFFEKAKADVVSGSGSGGGSGGESCEGAGCCSG